MLTPLPVLIPTLGAAMTLFAGRRPRLQRVIALAALSVVVAVCAALLYLADRDGTLALQVGGWGQTVPGMGPLGITLVVDRLSALMLRGVLDRAAGGGRSTRSGRASATATNVNRCRSSCPPIWCCRRVSARRSWPATCSTCSSDSRCLLSASFVLLTIGASKERVRAGISYVMVSMVSSLVFLFGIALVYAATGTLNMAELAVRLDGVSAGTRSALFAVLLVAFGIKAAVFPLSTWLPDSYPTAPAPVTAVFAGLLTKVGVYAIIRAHSLLFPSGGLDPMLLVAALLTMLVGILGAIAQSDIKRLLSFTLVSHIGYMVFGIALSSRARHVGRDLLRGPPHPGADDAVPGRRADRAPGRRVHTAAPRRAGRRQPDPGLRLRGPGTQSRWYSAVLGVHRQGGAARGRRAERLGAGVVLVGGGVVTSLLTLYVVARVWTKAFWRSREDAPEGHLSGAAPPCCSTSSEDIDFVDRDDVGRMPVGMLLPTGALIAVGLTLTVLAGPIFAYSERAAAEVLDRGQYISAVLGTDDEAHCFCASGCCAG